MFSYATSVAQSARQCSEATYKQIIGDKDAANAAKKQLPIFCYQATFLFGKRSIKNAQPNGLVMTDFDGLTAEQIAEAVNLLKQLRIVHLIHITPSGKGLRVVFEGYADKTYVENQHIMADFLKLPLDEACKDLARCSFAVPEDHIIHLDSQLFTYNNPLHSQLGARTSSSASRDSENNAFASQNAGEAPALPVTTLPEWEKTDGKLSYKGVCYETIIKEWFAQTGGEPKQGERNVKLHRLATNLRYITDNRKDVLLAVLPNFGLPENEMRQLIASACEPRMMWMMPKTLASVLRTLGVNNAAGQDTVLGNSILNEFMTREENDYWLRRLAEIKLPKGLKDSV